MLAGLLLVLGARNGSASGAASPTIGLPITRSYSIEEIGVTRGPHLNFDRLGRLAVIGGGSYIVLNDGAWIELLRNHPNATIPLDVINTADGRSYFGALASWGFVEYTDQGNLKTRATRPATYPSWINSTNFTQVLAFGDGVLFSGINGVVYQNCQTDELRFFEIPEVATTFIHQEKVHVSSHTLGTLELNPTTGELRPVAPDTTVHLTATLRDGRVIGATTGSRLVYFDGATFTESAISFGADRAGGISSLEALSDGGFAVAVNGDGLYLFTDDATCRMALTTNPYRRIYDLVTRESGVLWIAMESSIEKLLYNEPVSVIDQRSDVIVGWPQVFQWGDQSVIASNGRLYDVVLSPDGRHSIFQEYAQLPPGGAWAVAANDRHLIIGNNDAIYARTPTGFERIVGLPGANRLFLPEEDLCVVVGRSEIAAMRWENGRWTECAPRIPGLGFPLIALDAGDSLWIELGLDRAARVWFAEGALHTRVFEDFPWSVPSWINIGRLQDLIVFSGPDNQRVYLDAATGETVPAPALEATLAKVPVTILRIVEDDQGVIWLTYPNGVVTLHPNEQGYVIDTESLSSISDLYPVITLLNESHAWISTESALYHVTQGFAPPARRMIEPFLVSIQDGKTGRELFSAARHTPALDALPYARNHLVFRFFSGGYTTKRDPVYEFSMQNGPNSWNVQSAGSLLTLPQLEEGDYRLTAQLKYDGQPLGQPVLTTFSIRPPWYRAPLAYAAYWSSGLLVCFGVAAWASGQARRKHDFLEQLVRERTDELRTTMAKLTEEARTSATLAERYRLAGEIHDSLQQGLTGLALHLETTLKIEQLEPDIRSRLSVARRMVSFTRQEVQQAVWDLESPLLQNDDLGEALHKLGDLIGTNETEVRVEVTGTGANVSSTIKHHLLRIAQEAVTNAVRHSGAKHVEVCLDFTAVDARLSVRDDGRGFVTEEVLTIGLGHFGLRGLRSRAQKIHGDLHIESVPGHGTKVSITVPLTPEASHALI